VFLGRNIAGFRPGLDLFKRQGRMCGPLKSRTQYEAGKESLQRVFDVHGVMIKKIFAGGKQPNDQY
jgi:hypothetical protein